MSDWNAGIVKEFRANDGKVGGMFEGASLLILHTTGAKSGEPRVSPLVYQDLDGRYAIFASKAGAPSNPDWFYNLKANPDVSIEIGTETIAATTYIAETDERSPIWEKQKAAHSNFAEYEVSAGSRQIPVIIVTPK